MGRQPFLELMDVWKVYSTGATSFEALRGVTLSVAKGEFLALVGPSGSGKSTLLSIAGTLALPSRGRVLLGGIEVAKLGRRELAELRNRELGFVFQSYNLVSYLSALENVELPMTAAGVPGEERRRRARALLEELGLAAHLNKKPAELSGGEQQRVAIARALANEPSLILADEPTGNLDSKSAHAVATLLKRICRERGVTVIMATHNLELVKYAQRMVRLRDGRIEGEEVVGG
ncbi:MAG: macrolide ABC transporter ATP-binding protein [Nitrososphaerota archaeon]